MKYDGSSAVPIKEVPADATVSDIQVDGRGWIWIVTDQEILVGDNLAGPYKVFTVDEGVGSTLISGGTYSISRDMYFATRPEGEHPGGLTRITAR